MLNSQVLRLGYWNMTKDQLTNIDISLSITSRSYDFPRFESPYCRHLWMTNFFPFAETFCEGEEIHSIYSTDIQYRFLAETDTVYLSLHAYCNYKLLF